MATKNGFSPSYDKEGLLLSVALLLSWTCLTFIVSLIGGRMFSIGIWAIIVLTPVLIGYAAKLTFRWSPMRWLRIVAVYILVKIAVIRMEKLLIAVLAVLGLYGCTMLWRAIPDKAVVSIPVPPAKSAEPKEVAVKAPSVSVEQAVRVKTDSFILEGGDQAAKSHEVPKKPLQSNKWLKEAARKLPKDRPAIPGKEYEVENLSFLDKFAITVRACHGYQQQFGDVIGCTVTMLKTCYRESSCRQDAYNPENHSHAGKFGSHSYFAIRTKLHNLGSCDANGKISLADTYNYRKSLEWSLNYAVCKQVRQIGKRSLYAHNGATTPKQMAEYDRHLRVAEKKLHRQFNKAIVVADPVNRQWLQLALKRLKTHK